MIGKSRPIGLLALILGGAFLVSSNVAVYADKGWGVVHSLQFGLTDTTTFGHVEIDDEELTVSKGPIGGDNSPQANPPGAASFSSSSSSSSGITIRVRDCDDGRDFFRFCDD